LFQNLSLLVLEILLLAAFSLFLHARSRRYGLAPLLIYLAGLVVLLHTISPIQVHLIFGGANIVITSVLLVPVILMTLLVLYEAEGTAAARLAILGIMGLSVLSVGVQLGIQTHLSLPGGGNTGGFTAEDPIFNQAWTITVASLLSFTGSLFGIVIVHQALSEGWKRFPRWAAPGAALVTALVLDELIFKTVTLNLDSLTSGIPAGLTGKVGAGLLVWPLVAWYLARVAPHLKGFRGTAKRRPLDVIFGTYRTQETALLATEAEKRRAEEALAASELRFRTTFEQVGVGLVHTGMDGRMRMVNQAMCDLLGYRPEELTRLGWDDITHPQDRETTNAGIRCLLEEGLPLFEVDKRYLRRDATPVWAHVTASLVRDSEGNPAYFVAAVEDLTDRRITEENLRQAQKMEAVGQLTGGIAHDFNNLLTVIMGGLELARTPDADPQEKEQILEEAYAAASRGASLTQRLLAFSRKQALRPRALRTVAVLEGMRELLTRTLGENITIKIDARGKVGECKADQAQLENAVLNLALNARDAMPGGGTLRIRSEQVTIASDPLSAPDTLAGEYIRISVTDNGTGIPTDHLEKIFDPFFTTKGAGKGSGLGLSMVYGFTRQSGGFVTVESQEGEGTSIRMHLPLAEEAPPIPSEP
jgi:PAS domain S-box-containing protein